MLDPPTHPDTRCQIPDTRSVRIPLDKASRQFMLLGASGIRHIDTKWRVWYKYNPFDWGEVSNERLCSS
jgi:hypothetical protein